MNNRKHKLPTTIVGICLIGLIGFKDTGIFVKEYLGTKEDGTKVVFSKEENVNIIKENDRVYIIERENTNYEVPKDNIIKVAQNYIVIKDTNILDKPEGNSIGLLTTNQVVQAIEYEENYGLFSTERGTKGYIKLSDVEIVEEENISYGISKVDKVLKNDKSFYTLIKGEMVSVKDFKDDIYTIIDEEGNEFKVGGRYIELRNTREKVTRGNVSKRAASVTKLIKTAYGELGKPYVSADTGKRGYDCSGFTYSMYLNVLGIKLNRSSSDQVKNGVEVKRDELIPGDLVFFRTTGKGIGHVGLYIGDNNMIHASSGRKQVTISSLDEAYYKARYVTGRRILNN